MNIKYLSSLNKVSDKNKKTRVHYTNEQKKEAVELAVKTSAVEASSRLNIPYTTLRKWFKEKRAYNVRSETFKSKVINRYKELGVITKAAQEFNVEVTTLRFWLKKRGLICVTQ